MYLIPERKLKIHISSENKEIEIKGIVKETKDNTVFMVAENDDIVITEEQPAKSDREGINSREFFRQDISAEAMVGYDRPSIPCQVVNISGNGLCFRCVNSFKVKDIVYLKVPLTKTDTFNFSCQIVRVNDRGKEREYGCRMVRLSPREESALLSIIFKLQRQK